MGLVESVSTLPKRDLFVSAFTLSNFETDIGGTSSKNMFSIVILTNASLYCMGDLVGKKQYVKDVHDHTESISGGTIK